MKSLDQFEAEIARLHAVNAELVEALRALYDRHNAETMARARAALSKALGE